MAETENEGASGASLSDAELRAGVVLSDYACKVCGNVPDRFGWLYHGRGCYTQSPDGGGVELIVFDAPNAELTGRTTGQND